MFIILLNGLGVATQFRRFETGCYECLGERRCARNSIDEWHIEDAGQPLDQVSHAGASKNDGLGAILFKRAVYFIAQALEDRAIIFVKIKNGNLSAAHTCAARGQSIPHQVHFNSGYGSIERRDHGEAARQHARGMKRGFTYADNGNIYLAPGGIQPCIIEACYDDGVDVVMLCDLLEEARNAHRDIVITLDTLGSDGGICGDDLRFWSGNKTSSLRCSFGH